MIIKDQPEGVPDLVPLFVAGGVPIQTYLRDLMNRLSNPGSEHALSEGMLQLDESSDSLSSGTVSVLESSDSTPRDTVLEELTSWFSKHEPVQVRMPNLDYPVYVWRSFLQGEVDNHVPPPPDRVAQVGFLFNKAIDWLKLLT